MTEPTPIATPAGYAPAYAVGFADPATNLVLVSEINRLPVTQAAPAPAALAGQTSASGLVGPFDAVADRVVTVSLAGTWSGTVTLQRSTDGGGTRGALRVAGEPWGIYTQSGCEQAWLETENGTSFYLDISLTGGELTYRVSQ